MNKIYALGKSIYTYLLCYSYIRPPFTFTCETASCNHRVMHKHGRYFRIAVTKHGFFKIPIYRWRCCLCKITLALVPDFLVPAKHFVTLVREAAMKRKAQGQSFDTIAKGVVSVAAGGINPRTIKRWWNAHLHQAGDTAQFIAGELIQYGVEEDLLRSHSQGVNPTPVNTVRWFASLIPRYAQALGQRISFRVGSFGFLNTRLASHLRI